MTTSLSPLLRRRSARTSAETADLAREAASAFLHDPCSQARSNVAVKAGTADSGVSISNSIGKGSATSGRDEMKIHKLDGSA